MNFRVISELSEARRTLDMVYEMYMEGVNERTLSELDTKIQAMNENTVASFVEAKSKKIQKTCQWYVLLP